MTPLITAMYGGNLEVTKLLLDRGADVNSRGNVRALACSAHSAARPGR